jgi:carbonic anhydrase
MMRTTCTRILGLVLLCLAASIAGCAVRATCPAGAKAEPVGADVALARLREGNQRFVAGTPVPDKHLVQRRVELTKGQNPFAIIVSCSDSRVGPEVIFDQGLGDIFVVRTAGHVVDDVGLGSIEYAAAELHTPCIVVLGHQRCGGVSAAVAGKADGHIQALVEAIRPAVEATKGQPGDAVDNAVRANVRLVAAMLQKSEPILSGLIKAGKLRVVGAVYNLDTGRVEWFQ